MDFVAYNFSWITFNLTLALIPVLLTFILRNKMPSIVRLPISFIWLLFLPNTIYMVSDIQYLPVQFYLSDFNVKLILLAQYGLVIFLGFITYFYALKPLEEIVKKNKFLKSNKIVVIVLFNLLISFGVTLGKFIRVHSWYLFTNTTAVYKGVVDVFITPYLLLYFLLFGILVNLIYFYTNGYFKKSRRK